MKLRKLLSSVLAAVLALSVFALPVRTEAAGTGLLSGSDAAAALLDNRQENVTIQQPNDGTGVVLPEKYDLRELGVVTPVKYQNPFGTCWGFSAIAAAETSILSESGLTYEQTGLDLSEHHLTYFSRIPFLEENQVGEGWHISDNVNMFDQGGVMFIASSVFSSGVGVVPEELVPYRGLEARTESVGPVNLYYSPDDDWTLPEEYRMLQSYELEESSLLPSPAVYAPEVFQASSNWERQSAYLGYDATATENVKKELLSGRAVSVAFAADQARPGDEGPFRFLNTETWAHFTFNGAGASHAVAIVGYDDTYPATNFLDHSEDPYGDGLPHQPEGDGAWIVKNSWGADTESFPNNNDWGIVNDEGQHTGYFYLSYYDRSISLMETFDFDVSGVENSYIIEQYDFLPSEIAQGWMDTNVLKMANIFTAEFDGVVRNLSCETSVENASVTYEVYLMDETDTVPTDGELATTQEAVYRYPGYHRVVLSQPVPVAKGQRYAVVVTESANVDDTVYYSLSTNCAFNKDGMDAENYTIFMDNLELPEEYLTERLVNIYAVGIVNPGESMLYIDELGGWADWSEVVTGFQTTKEFCYVDFDNFPVKAYLDFTDLGDYQQAPMPELKFAPPAGDYDTIYVLKRFFAALGVLLVVIIVAVILIVRAVKLHRHPELRKPKKPRKPSYKALKAQLDEANLRIAQLEQPKPEDTDSL